MAFVLAGLLIAFAVAAIVSVRNQRSALNSNNASPIHDTRTSAPTVLAVGDLGVAQAVMVTVDLDFGPKPPSIAEALEHIERRYEPQDGVGRTFAIIEAFGEPTPDGKLRMSMKVSTEKPGAGSLIFKRTGETLWRSRIAIASSDAVAHSFDSKSLTILLDNLQGKTWMVDGSSNPGSLLKAKLRDSGVLVSSAWQEGAEMEANFIYSACGCPVKVRARRVGDRTVRTKELPVIFPDDPAVVRVIESVMGW
jgi:hypothetical protein